MSRLFDLWDRLVKDLFSSDHKISNADILLVATESMGFCKRRIHDGEVRYDSFCLSSHLPNALGFDERIGAVLCNDYHNSLFADEDMVLQSSGITDRCPSTCSSVRVTDYPVSDKKNSFQSMPILLDSMEDFGQERSATGYSLVDTSSCKGTRQTCTAKIPTLCKLLWETGSRSRECVFVWRIS